MATGICQLLLPQAEALKSCCELILRHQTRAQPQQRSDARKHARARCTRITFPPISACSHKKLKITAVMLLLTHVCTVLLSL